MPAPSDLRGLYAVTPDLADASLLLAKAEAALAGGCRLLQYRDKISDAEERRERARALRQCCRRHGAKLIINDHVELAIAMEADGVHLGRDDGDVARARARLGHGRIIGTSCYADLGLARAAVSDGADYVAFGAVFPSGVKPQAVQAPLELFRRARDELAVPLCGIGGIRLDNAAQVVAGGADMVAVITDLFDAPDIARRAAAFQRLFEDSPA